jgi:hypothetical protein
MVAGSLRAWRARRERVLGSGGSDRGAGRLLEGRAAVSGDVDVGEPVAAVVVAGVALMPKGRAS